MTNCATTWVLFAGLPATGKSRLAGAIENRLNAAVRNNGAPAHTKAAPEAVILDKDRIRAALFPGEFTDYTAEQNSVCMRAILDAAAYLTARRRVRFILLDGRTFSRREHIEEVLTAAGRAGATWRILHLACPDEVAEARLQRGDPHHPARDRTVELYRRLQRDFEPIHQPKFDIDSTRDIEKNLEEALRYLQS